MKHTLALALNATALAAFAFAQPAPAQSFPAKPIRIVVPFAPGGTSDILARLIGAKLNESWGQTVIVDNRPGATGNIGADLVAKSPPDGYTTVLMDVGNLSISPSLYPKLPFDILKDFAPVTTISYSPHLLCTHPSVPVKTVKELVALAKAKPGKLNYGSTGLGSAPHLAGLLFSYRTGVKWVDIPAKGGAQSIIDVASGEADVLFNGMLATLPHVKSGRLKLIAISSDKRVPALPETPTVAEAGNLPGFVTGSWQGMLAPARTPPELVNRINAEVVRIITQSDTRQKLVDTGAYPIGDTPQQFGQWLAESKERWAKLIKATGFKLDN